MGTGMMRGILFGVFVFAVVASAVMMSGCGSLEPLPEGEVERIPRSCEFQTAYGFDGGMISGVRSVNACRNAADGGGLVPEIDDGGELPPQIDTDGGSIGVMDAGCTPFDAGTQPPKPCATVRKCVAKDTVEICSFKGGKAYGQCVSKCARECDKNKKAACKSKCVKKFTKCETVEVCRKWVNVCK